MPFPIKQALWQQKIISWYNKHGRHDLPWQQAINAYRVWVSEIMLQQTQVKTVIPYFNRFIQRFPNVHALATASIDEVLHYWTGLGYYARGRNLHKTAQIISDNYHGELPQTVDALNKLPGIGQSTAGAIVAIAYQKKAAILDGNVKRVLARVFAIDGWSGTTSVAKKFWQYAEYYTPENNAAEYTQAMMDLGATLCTRTKSLCQQCPVNSYCQAYQTNSVEYYPTKKPKKNTPLRACYFLLLKNNKNQILLQRRPPAGIWASLWSFPEASCIEEINTLCQTRFNLTVINIKPLESFKHTFSHFQLEIHPVVCEVSQVDNHVMESETMIWYDSKSDLQIGLPRPITKLLALLS